MKTIYIVTEGEYSAYHICGVFSTKEAAEEYIAFFEKHEEYSSHHEIEEYIVDEPIDEKINFRYRIDFDDNGTIVNTTVQIKIKDDFCSEETERDDNSVYLSLNEDNLELAKKIAIDEYFQYKTYYKFEFYIRTIDGIKYDIDLMNTKTEILKNIPENTIHKGRFHFGEYESALFPYKADIFLEKSDRELAANITIEMLGQYIVSIKAQKIIEENVK